jgi:hypothetical protein
MCGVAAMTGLILCGNDMAMCTQVYARVACISWSWINQRNWQNESWGPRSMKIWLSCCSGETLQWREEVCKALRDRQISFGVWLIVFVWRRHSTLRSFETLFCGDVFSFAAVTVVLVRIWELWIRCRKCTCRAPVPRKLQHCRNFYLIYLFICTNEAPGRSFDPITWLSN